MDAFTTGYIECALWASSDDQDTPLDQSNADLSEDALITMHSDCVGFQRNNAVLLAQASAEGRRSDYLGHDFWLTRNGHGAGFWDGRLSKALGMALTDAAHKTGERSLYVSDAGTIEQEGV